MPVFDVPDILPVGSGFVVVQRNTARASIYYATEQRSAVLRMRNCLAYSAQLTALVTEQPRLICQTYGNVSHR
jgi:hypothetical protein